MTAKWKTRLWALTFLTVFLFVPVAGFIMDDYDKAGEMFAGFFLVAFFGGLFLFMVVCCVFALIGAVYALITGKDPMGSR